ncbi:MAG: ribulose-phosphate 3-epimerase [Candidatus Riflebacteria bacterium]|nr:ribulose-phosphate 3-epimerase [Candidatus Riflebacteria bacterium]
MKKNILIAPSILSADFSNMASELAVIKDSGADWIHVDVMDGHFVPNMTFGPPLIKSYRKNSDMIFDVHLMTEAPERLLESYKDAGADRLTFHVEACRHSHRYLRAIRDMGLASGITLNPQTPASAVEYLLEECDQVLIMSVNPGFGGQSFIEPVLQKIQVVKKMIKDRGLKTLIQVDGGVNSENSQRICDAGADVLVMGSAFFNEKDKKSFVNKIKGTL